jgi:hypothetical protein
MEAKHILHTNEFYLKFHPLLLVRMMERSLDVMVIVVFESVLYLEMY